MLSMTTDVSRAIGGRRLRHGSMSVARGRAHLSVHECGESDANGEVGVALAAGATS